MSLSVTWGTIFGLGEGEGVFLDLQFFFFFGFGLWGGRILQSRVLGERWTGAKLNGPFFCACLFL